MKTKLIKSVIPVVCMLAACNNSGKFPPIAVTYPETAKDTVVDEYYGVKVADPYRWLEDDNSEKTIKWVKAQNKVTFQYLGQIPFRDIVRKRLDNNANFEKYSLPIKKNGKYYYF